MSMSCSFSNISTRSYAEAIVASFKEKIKFVMTDKKAKGYFFEMNQKTGKIYPQESPNDPIIYPFTYIIEEKGPDNFSLIVFGPYTIIREIKIEQFKAKDPNFARPKPLRIERKREALDFNGNLREYQKRDCPRIIEQMETNGTCFFVADPGYGKTVVMCYVASFYKVKTLVIVPGVGLALQTMKELKNRFPKANAMVYENGAEIDQSVDIVVTFAQRIDRSFDKLAEDVFKQFELVVLDEIHLLCAPHSLAGVLCTSPKRILGLTATPGSKSSICEMIVGPKTFDSSMIKRWSISFPRITSGLDKNFTGFKGYGDALNEVLGSDVYLAQIARMINFFVKCGERIIVITMRTGLSDRLYDHLKDDFSCQILGQKSKILKNCDIIIGTHKMIGTGFDLSNYIDDFDGKNAGVVFFLGSIKDPTLLYQICGRSFRSDMSHAIYPIVEDITVFKNHGVAAQKLVREFKACRHKEGFSLFLEGIAAGK